MRTPVGLPDVVEMLSVVSKMKLASGLIRFSVILLHETRYGGLGLASRRTDKACRGHGIKSPVF
jgi:hypothetical protein